MIAGCESSRINHSGMHIARQRVHIEVEIMIGFHFELFLIVNFVPQTALYRSTYFVFTILSDTRNLVT